MPAFRPWGGGGEGGKCFIRILELFGKTDGGKQSHAWRYCPVLVTERFCTFSLECLRAYELSLGMMDPVHSANLFNVRFHKPNPDRGATAYQSGGSGEQQQPTWQMFVLSSQACLAASVEAWHVSLLEVQ